MHHEWLVLEVMLRLLSGLTILSLRLRSFYCHLSFVFVVSVDLICLFHSSYTAGCLRFPGLLVFHTVPRNLGKVLEVSLLRTQVV